MSAVDPALVELARIASALGPALVPPGHDELLTSICEVARQVFGAGACSIALVDEDELVYRAAAGADPSRVIGMRLPIARGIAGFVASSGHGIAVDDVRRDPRFASDVAERIGYVPDSLLAVPIAGSEPVVGVLSILDRDASRVVGLDAMDLAARFAEEAAVAIQLGAAFGDLGRALTHALSVMTEDVDLHDALLAAGAADSGLRSDLAGFAALNAGLSQLGTPERDTAIRILNEFVTYARGRRRR